MSRCALLLLCLFSITASAKDQPIITPAICVKVSELDATYGRINKIHQDRRDWLVTFVDNEHVLDAELDHAVEVETELHALVKAAGGDPEHNTPTVEDCTQFAKR